MSNLRWSPYVLLTGEKLENMFATHFHERSKVLVIMGKGFDVRMNIALNQLQSNLNKPNITCLLISFDEGESSISHRYKSLVDDNVKELNSLLLTKDIIIKNIQLWKKEGKKKRRVGDRSAADIINTIDLNVYTDILVDISALPRGIYFSLIGKILTLIDLNVGKHTPNLMVAVAENPALDSAIIDDIPHEDLNFLHGFGGGIDLSSSDLSEPTIWLPVLGENKQVYIRKAYEHLAPNEMCPVLPYPSRDPRRPDSLIVEYHDLLFDDYRVEPQNIMYVPEQNPFEAYRILSNTINNYNKSLQTIGGCKAVLSTFSSKLISIGTLLAAYELKANNIGVGVLSVDSQGYNLDKEIDLNKLRNESKLFVTWLTGDPYH